MRLLYLPAYYEPEKYSGLYINKNIIEAFLEDNVNNEIIMYTPVPTRGVSASVRKEYKKRKVEELYNGRLKIYRYYLMKEKKSTLQRFFRYIIQGFIQIIRTRNLKNIDVIIMSSTPPTNGIVASLIKKRLKTSFIYNLQDIFPDSLVSTNLTKNRSIIYKIGAKLEKITYKNADIINVPSIDFKTNLIKKNVSKDKINIIYNWVDEQKIKPIEKENNKIFEQFNLNRNKFYVVYAGNIGKAQNVNLILEVAKQLNCNEDIQFAIFGEGAEKETISQKVKKEKISNVRIFPLQPYESTSNVYSMSDVSIVICKKGFGSISIPSKTWSIMSTATPIIANFDRNTELEKIIEENEIGIFTQAEKLEELKEAILQLYNNRNLVSKYGKNARKYIDNNLTKKIGTQKYIEEIKSFKNKKRGIK